MARLAREHGAGLLLGLAFALWPALAAALGLEWSLELAARILIYALAAGALNLVLGYGGLVSFGHAAFFGAGAYVVAILAYHDMVLGPVAIAGLEIPGTSDAWIAFPLAVLVAGLLALVIGALSLRTNGLYFIMITLAFAQMIYYLFVSLPDYGGEDGLSLFARSSLRPLELDDNLAFYYLCLGLLALLLAAKALVVRARFGWALMGIRDNERRMTALGLPTFRYKLAAFVLSGAVTGLAGALIANLTEFVSPAFLSWPVSGELLVMVILGGIGRLYGPLYGATALLLLEFALKEWSEHWQLALGPILILVVLFARGGLAGLRRPRGAGHG
ncbi:amino acid/amide ABC transporter membrane protein 2, HAAT family [Tistlia consotensis]|uniref:Amino acid/amide ABC transporter membrane protein 2, HAAT family n=1 Tax=Tistlia consotensis USBA 355 TaxID=560819 RepID=A0A1Y6BWW0_9PROT|nr:branched-chain amino acid ABC transporter permease [Tistlia consotensis]SMF24024.1 amino acid/amide ABC transporter membrane protein 2, HAAT family [Tistlia consotensis USBA 355]SNR60986.1 amino acid/amide ABC transporter membrane protein 2, HAAT family [Tistlia consotensis]